MGSPVHTYPHRTVRTCQRVCLEDVLIVVIVVVSSILFGRWNEHVPDAGEYHFDQMALFHGVFGDGIRREQLHADMDEP